MQTCSAYTYEKKYVTLYHNLYYDILNPTMINQFIL